MVAVVGKVVRCRTWVNVGVNVWKTKLCCVRAANYSHNPSAEANFYGVARKMVSLIGDSDLERRHFNVASYEDVRDASKKANVWLIDVRDKLEIERSGCIPGAINIPLDDLEAALQFTSEYFFNRYQVSKPIFDSDIIFTCRSGRRSKIAYELAESVGFTKLKNFDGGWLLYEQRCDFG